MVITACRRQTMATKPSFMVEGLEEFESFSGEFEN
jgi:hypothetical protein